MSAKPILTISTVAMGFAALATGAVFADATGEFAAGAAMQAPPKSAQNEDRSRRICRDVTPSGSRLVRRLCRTQAEWDESAQRSQDGLFKQQTETTTTYTQEAGPR